MSALQAAKKTDTTRLAAPIVLDCAPLRQTVVVTLESLSAAAEA